MRSGNQDSELHRKYFDTPSLGSEMRSVGSCMHACMCNHAHHTTVMCLNVVLLLGQTHDFIGDNGVPTVEERITSITFVKATECIDDGGSCIVGMTVIDDSSNFKILHNNDLEVC